MHAQPPKRIVLGVSGASGALYTQRLLSHLLELGHEVHFTITDAGKRLIFDELGLKFPQNAAQLAGLDPAIEPVELRHHNLYLHPIKDIGADIASGSFLHDGMVVMPASAHTLNAIASGIGDNLLCRAAAVALKERRPLVIAHRESPLTLIDIQNMERLTLAGAIIMPTNPGFYLLPKTIDEIVDFVVAKALDLLKIEHTLSKRWSSDLEAAHRNRDEL